jgi:hypothetical protein
LYPPPRVGSGEMMEKILTEIHNEILPISDLLSYVYGRLDVIVQLSLTQIVIKVESKERLNVTAILGI